jgi:hypothetical protein
MKNRQPLSRKNQLASLEPPWNCWGRCAGELERAADKVELTGKQWRRVEWGCGTKLAAGDGFGRSSECQNREDVSHPKRQKANRQPKS